MFTFAKKDLLLISKDIKIFLPIFVFINIIMGFDKLTFITSFYTIMTIMLLINTFSYEEKSNFYGYSASLPNGRKNIVKGKYLSMLILIIVSVIIILIMSFFLMKFKNILNLNEVFDSILISLFVSTLSLGFIFPIILKFGAEKGRFAVFLLMFGGSFSLSSLITNNTVKIPSIVTANLNIWISIISIILFIISYFVSLKIMKNKDF